MCRLLGFRGKTPIDLRGEILDYPNAILHQSVCDRDACKPNDDGWGYGFVRGNVFSVVKEATAPRNDPSFHDLAAQPFDSVLLHIRRASVGNVKKENTHPFQWKDELIFAHNGSIYGFDKIRDEAVQLLSPELRKGIQGQTDSEYAMVLFIHYLLESDALSSENISSFRIALSETMRTCRALSEKSGAGKPPKLNFMLMTKYFLVATRAGHTLGFYKGYRDGVLVTSEPLRDGDAWRAMEEDTMIALEPDGQCELMAV
jgi:predicted glutamine amidotransferase